MGVLGFGSKKVWGYADNVFSISFNCSAFFATEPWFIGWTPISSLILDKIKKNATDASALKKKETIENKNAFMLNIYNMKAKKTKSGWLDSNQRPHAPQTRTLTGLSYIPYCECKSSTFWRMHQIFRQLFFEFNKKMRHLPVMRWDDGGCGYVSRRGTYKIFPHFLWMKLFTNRTQKERWRLNFITTSLCRLFHTVFWHYFWREE